MRGPFGLARDALPAGDRRQERYFSPIVEKSIGSDQFAIYGHRQPIPDRFQVGMVAGQYFTQPIQSRALRYFNLDLAAAKGRSGTGKCENLDLHRRNGSTRSDTIQ